MTKHTQNHTHKCTHTYKTKPRRQIVLKDFCGSQPDVLRVDQVGLISCGGNQSATGQMICFSEQSAGALMDGGHRLCYALLMGHDTIKAVQFPTMPEPDEVHELT